MKKSVILYADCIAILEELSFEQSGRLFKAILSYINEEPVTEIDGDPAVKMAFVVIKKQIDRDADKYHAKCEKNREIAIAREKRKRELRQSTNVHERERTNTNSTDNDTDNDNKVTNVTHKSTTVDNIIAPNGALSPKAGDAINFDGLVKFFNSTLAKFRSVIRPIKDIKGKRQDTVRARVRERGKKSLIIVFENAAKSDFLNGKNERGFIASFDWLVAPNNFIKVLEGNYDNIQVNNGTANRTNHSAEQRAMDAASIVARLAEEDDARQ